jgi:anti-sigma regulatory factor (Ser/Thr protein kinase)
MMGAPGLFAVSTEPTTNFKSNEHKPLFAIRNSEDFKAGLAKVDQFTAGFGVEYQKTLRYVMSELLYNTMEHGKSDFYWNSHRYPTPSLLQFTWYEKIDELHFIVVDTGIGIRRHLSQAYPNIATDEEALQLAVQPEVSGTFGHQDPYANRNNAGMGLFLSSNIVRRLHADMYIISGGGLIHISPMDLTSRELASEWPGTIVLLTVRLDRGSLFDLQETTQQLREQARLEVEKRRDGIKENRHYVHMFNYFGKYADDKSAAIKYRDRHLLSVVDAGKNILLDFEGVESSTHSFLNALLASPIRRMGMLAFKRLKVVNASPDIRETVDYVLDDNTGEVPPEAAAPPENIT